MNGLKKLSETEKSEMIDDAESAERRRVFRAARANRNGGLDEYIEFLSETLPLFDIRPSARITKRNKL